MAQFGKLLFVFVITIILFVAGGTIVFRFMESTVWTAIVIGWAAITLIYTIIYLRSDQPKLPWFLGLIVAIVIVLVQKGLIKM